MSIVPPPTIITSINPTIRRSGILLDQSGKLNEVNLKIQPGISIHYFLIHGIKKPTNKHIHIKLKENSTVSLSGIIIGSNNDDMAANITVEHDGCQSESTITLRGVAGNSAHLKINGNIVINKKSTNAVARLDEKILLLSELSSAQAIPNLEIMTDEVKASHAATVSQIPEEEIFYLQTRGISRHQGANLIVRSFIHDALNHLPKINEFAKLDRAISRKLNICLT